MYNTNINTGPVKVGWSTIIMGLNKYVVPFLCRLHIKKTRLLCLNTTIYKKMPQFEGTMILYLPLTKAVDDTQFFSHIAEETVDSGRFCDRSDLRCAKWCVWFLSYTKNCPCALDVSMCHTHQGGILATTFASIHVIGQCCVVCQLSENWQQTHAAGTKIREATSFPKVAQLNIHHGEKLVDKVGRVFWSCQKK